MNKWIDEWLELNKIVVYAYIKEKINSKKKKTKAIIN
jgi:hypothetical protein